MNKRLARHDFVIRDLAISIGGGGGGTWMPGPDDETPPPHISPIASVLVNLGYIDAVRIATIDAVKAKRFEDIGRAFVAGDTGGHPAIRAAIQEIGTAVVASAAFAALGGGSAGLPNPECGGTSMETIPTPITPVIAVGMAVHKVSDLPRLRKQLAQAVAYLEEAAARRAPRGSEEIGAVREELEGALKSLGR